jgi:hypothetical protein
MSFLGNTPLSFLSGNSRSSASYDPANNPVQSDSEPEPEPELDAKSMAQRMLDERGAEPSVASALSKVLPWKSVGSAEEQADAVKDKLSYHVRKDRILLLCMAIEDEKATLVQRRWRLKISKRDHRLRDPSAAKLQAAVRGKQARLSHLPEHKVNVLKLKRAARKIQQYTRLTLTRNAMKRQCRGVIQKQGQIAIPFIGGMELVIWQPRFVYATDYSLCYQRLQKDRTTQALKRTGDCGIESSTRVIRFHEVLEVRAVLGQRLLCVSCKRRVFKFGFKSREQCELWASNLVQLINVAGFAVEGFIEMAPDDDAQKKHNRPKPVRKRAAPMNVY